MGQLEVYFGLMDGPTFSTIHEMMAERALTNFNTEWKNYSCTNLTFRALPTPVFKRKRSPRTEKKTDHVLRFLGTGGVTVK